MGVVSSIPGPERIVQLREAATPKWSELLPTLHHVVSRAVVQSIQEGPPNIRRVLLCGSFSAFEARMFSLLEHVIGTQRRDLTVEREGLEQLGVLFAHRGFTASDVTYILRCVFTALQQQFQNVSLSAWRALLEDFAAPLISHAVQVCSDLLQAVSRGRVVDHPDMPRWVRMYVPPNAMQPRFFGLCLRRAAEPHCIRSGDHRTSSLRRRFFSLRQRYLYVFDIEPEGLVNEDGPTAVVDLARIRRIDKGGDDTDGSVVLNPGSLESQSSSKTFGRSESSTNVSGGANGGGSGSGAGSSGGNSSPAVDNKNLQRYYMLTLQFGDSDLSHQLFFTSEISRNAWWRHLSNIAGVLSPYCSPSPPEVNQLSISALLQDRFPYRASVPDFEFIKMLGAGTFGRVIQVRHRASGAIFAMKIIRKSRFHSIRNVVEVRRERSVLEDLNNPYILRINATFQSESRIYFLLDYLPGGELLRHTQKAPGHHFDEAAARFYIAELAIALEYLRVRGVVHRDIKGDNLVLDEDGHLVLTDFGFAKKLSTGSKKDRTCCGTLAYIAPEMLQVHRSGYGVEVDWWSMGVVLFTVLTGYFPFLKTSRKDTVNAIINQPLQFPSNPPLTAEARDACHKLMTKKPEQRLASLSALKAHPWFYGFHWEACERRLLRPPFLPTSLGSGTGGAGGANPGDVKNSRKTDMEYEDERQMAATFEADAKHVTLEQDVFGPYFAAQEEAGSDRDDSESESDEDDADGAMYEKLDVPDTRATFHASTQMLRPYFSSMTSK